MRFINLDLFMKKCIAIGGAYSVDKDYRLMTRLPWFESEQPSQEIKQYVEEQLQKCDWTVDYVFSHICPLFMIYETSCKRITYQIK